MRFLASCLHVTGHLSDIGSNARGFFKQFEYPVDEEDEDIAYELLKSAVVDSSEVED